MKFKALFKALFKAFYDLSKSLASRGFYFEAMFKLTQTDVKINRSAK